MLQEPMLQQLRRIRIVTKNYRVLRGLQGVPFGIVCLMLASFELGWLRFLNQFIDPGILADLGILAASIAFCAALALCPLIGDYYDRLFGRVQQVERNKLDLIIRFLAVMVVISAAIRVDDMMNLPVSVTALALAAWFFYMWLSTDAFRFHLLIMACITLLFSVLPLITGNASFSKFFMPDHGGYELAIGSLLTVGGICDHLILIRTFRNTKESLL